MSLQTSDSSDLFARGEAVPATPGVMTGGEVWKVESGSMELYLARTHADGSAGRRSFLMELDAGDIVVGLPPEEHMGQTVGLLPVPSPGSVVKAVQAEDFKAAIREHPEEYATLMDRWLSRVTAAVVPGGPPILAHQFPLQGSMVSTSGGACCPPRGVVWVRVTRGSARYLGQDPALTPDSEPIPLAPGSWVVAAPETAFNVCRTADILTDPDPFGKFRSFRSRIIDLMVRQREQEAQEEQARVASLEGADQRAMNRAWADLAGVLLPQRVTRAQERTRDPLLQACVLVGRHLGVKVNPASRRTAQDPLSEIARASRMRVRRVSLGDRWWKEDGGPLVGWLQDGEKPVALIPTRPGVYDLIDPTGDAVVRVDERVASTLRPVAATFYLRLPARAVKVREVLKLAFADSGRDFYSLLILGALQGLMALAVPMATKFLFDTVLPLGDQRRLMLVVMSLIVVTAANTAFGVARAVSLLRFGGRFDSNLATAMFDRMLTLPMPFYRKYTIGDLASRSMGISQIREIVAGGTLDTVISSTFAAFSYFLLFFYDLQLTVLATILLLGNLLFLTANGFRQLQLQRQIADVAGQVSGVLFQILSALPKIRVAGAESRFFAYWAAVFARQMDLQYRAGRVDVALGVFTTTFPILATLALFAAVAYMGDIETGTLLAFLAAFAQCSAGIAGLASSATEVAAALPQIERTRPILEVTPEVDESKSDPGELAGSIELANVTFRYRPDDPPVLDDVSLKVAPREFVALVGPTGAGKSTTMNLLLGFDEPETGTVFYDSKDLRTLDLQAVRQQIGVVLQNGQIFKDTVFRNIVGARPLTVEEAWEAVRMVGLEPDVKAMPMGMDTVVSEDTFSGGQAQRLLIARAIVSRPRLIYFDEATSALDNETQAIVSRSLEDLNASRIVIAHRLSTIKAADRIYVFQQGAVVQQGTFDELAAQPGLFHELMQRQMVG